ncbi:plasmid mobilization relaxosome protein MobC [Burkholderia multivorans]|uniref:plasmid mobilization relaxosome protein MobC n=1 Tax=Burkholderia multivorans TaxID=87883 RepID=UPI000D008C1B|nr:plasmid mobilization relaxosome protein MobC [Burkholderia multivorans]PRE74021.1 plasmid mobilization relaxosome protein MobC [Burkholderia multivorans]PRE87381.1 plasmid mobilization relaxosome protein MobC [Burkholderia multivorans]
MEKQKASKSGQYLDAYLGALKEPWAGYCKALGKKPGAAIKEAIEQQLEKAGKNPQPKTYHQAQEAPVGEPKVRFEILLTESEKRAIRERANTERCSMRRWIIDACRAGLTREPQFGMREIDALGESNYQLLAIGRNLNQIARRLNEGKSAKVTVEQIEKLTAIIDKHTDVVSTAIRASLERWNIE